MVVPGYQAYRDGVGLQLRAVWYESFLASSKQQPESIRTVKTEKPKTWSFKNFKEAKQLEQRGGDKTIIKRLICFGELQN